MLSISTPEGKTLLDQRGVWLYDGRAGESILVACPDDTCPMRWDPAHMIQLWKDYHQWGDYTLHFTKR